MADDQVVKLMYFSESLGVGGAEKYVCQLIRGLEQERYRISFVCPDKGPLLSLLQDLELLETEVLRLEPVKGPSDLAGLWRQRKFFRQHRPDLVHFNMPNPYASQYSIVAARSAAIRRMVATFHVPPKQPTDTFKGRRLERLEFRLLKRVIAVSEGCKRQLLNNFPTRPDRVVTIHNGINADDFGSAADPIEKRRDFNLEPDTPVVGVVGRMSTEKGHKYLIDAAPKIAAQVPGVKFLLVGEGPCLPDLIEQCKSLGMRQDTIFAGFREDVAEILSVCDVAVVPSLYESFGFAVLEAMLMGKPVVGTNVEGIPELLADGETGLLVPPADPDKLAEAIIDLLRDRAKAHRMGENGKQRSQRFSFDATLAKTKALYEELLRG